MPPDALTSNSETSLSFNHLTRCRLVVAAFWSCNFLESVVSIHRPHRSSSSSVHDDSYPARSGVIRIPPVVPSWLRKDANRVQRTPWCQQLCLSLSAVQTMPPCSQLGFQMPDPTSAAESGKCSSILGLAFPSSTCARLALSVSSLPRKVRLSLILLMLLRLCPAVL